MNEEVDRQAGKGTVMMSDGRNTGTPGEAHTVEPDPHRRRGEIGMLLRHIVVAIIITLTVMASEASGQVNSILLNMNRIDHPELAEHFRIEVAVSLEGVSGVTDVTVTSGGGVDVPMTGDGGVRWSGSIYPPDLAGLKTATQGTWQIVVDGSSPSTSTFTMSGNALQESDFFATPTGLFPAHGAVGVPSDVVLSWNDPTGTETADVLFIVIDGTLLSQEDNSLNTMSMTDTSWKPPLDLEDGNNIYFVGYTTIDAAGLVGQFNVLSGSITWGDFTGAPEWYPASTPFLVHGAQTHARFTVGTSCMADSDYNGTVNVLDLLALLASWGPCPPPCPEDNDGSGTVDVLDLLALLAAWGPCP